MEHEFHEIHITEDTRDAYKIAVLLKFVSQLGTSPLDMLRLLMLTVRMLLQSAPSSDVGVITQIVDAVEKQDITPLINEVSIEMATLDAEITRGRQSRPN